MNRVSEQAIYTINYKLRSIVYQAGLLLEFQCFSTKHSGYIKNRIPTAALPYGEGVAKDATILIEAYLDKLPNLKKVIVFGCSMWPILAKDKFPRKDGLIIKTDLYVFVGIKGSSIYRLYNMLLCQEETYADISCNKYLYPWRKH